MPPSQFDSPGSSQYDKLQLLLPSTLDEQRRIADFLDTETARIDQMSQLQDSVVSKLSERESAELDGHIDRLTVASGNRFFA